MLESLNQRNKFLLLVVFLVVSIASSRALPFMEPDGLDLHNLLVYQRCSIGRTAYLIDGFTCGDVLGRSMYYPPLLYHSFRWLRPISLESAMRIWRPFNILALAGIFYWWVRIAARSGRDARLWDISIFCGLMLLQYPVMFTLERGQSDVVPVLIFTVGAYFFARRKIGLAGALLGLATAYKLYPVFACAVVGLGLLLAGSKRGTRLKLDWLKFGASALLVFVAANLVFLKDAKIYYFKVLPQFAACTNPPLVYAHSIPSLTGAQYNSLAWLLCAALVALWGWAAAQAFERGEAPIALAGALSICTYFAADSYDYDLVTTYPLLLLLFLRARRVNRWGLLALGLFAVVGERQLFANAQAAVFNPATHVALQLAFFAVTAIIVARPAENDWA